MKKLIPLFLLLLTFNTYAAQEVIVTFWADAPTMRQYNSVALGLSEIKGFDYDCGTESGVYTKKGNITQPMQLKGNIWTDLTFTPGTWYCGMKTVDIKGLKSEGYSPEFTFTIPVEVAPPGYPPNVTTKVEVNITYGIVPIGDVLENR